MKNFLIILFLIPLFALGTNRYISSGGDNTTGLTPSTAWQTVAKLNLSWGSIVAGDSILFHSGETFYGEIIVGKSGLSTQNIVIGSYGTGATPIISGLSTVTGWVNLGGNIWEAPTVGVKDSVNLVLRDNLIMQVGRFPNTNASNSGYLTYTASTPTSITGPALSTTTNWTGAEVAIRLHRWEIKRRRVTSHSGGVVGFATMTDVPSLNYGYFFQRDPRTLDRDGEWYYNISTSKLRMYFGNNNPAAYTIKISTIDTLFFSSSKSQITVINLSFIGSNVSGMMLSGGTNLTIRNCSAINNGGDGIASWFSLFNIFDRCTTDLCLGSGIRVFGSSTAPVNHIVMNCSVNHTALIAGMETTDKSSAGNGINVNGGSNVTIINNTVKNSGHHAVRWFGDNVLIRYNFIDSFCLVRDDGGGIYSFQNNTGVPVTTHFNRRIISNIVTNGIGASDGAFSSDLSPSGILSRFSANGIYDDEGVRDVIMDSNLIANCAYQGFQGNGNGNLFLRYNTVFNVPISDGYQRLKNESPLTGFVITKNTFYPYRLRFRDQAINIPATVTPENDVIRMGTLDSNWYCTKTGTDSSLDIQTARTVAPTNFLESWRPFSYLTGTIGIETHSVFKPNTGILRYNETSINKTFVLGANYRDVRGNLYTGLITLAPFKFEVLLYDSPTFPNIPPVAYADTNRTITLPTNSSTLHGSATDVDGTIASVSWIRFSGPATGIINTPNDTTTVVSGLTQGVYQYRLIVIDDNGAADTAFVIVTVNAAPINQPPTVVASADQTITQPTAAVAVTSVGNDPEGGSLTYLWTKLSGPASGNIVTPNSANTTINGLTLAGVYQYRITVTDNGSLTGTDNVRIQVDSLIVTNEPPVADAGPNRNITLPINTTTLTGNATDPDGTISLIVWSKVSGPSTGTIVSPNSAVTTFNNLVQGLYQMRIVVTDNLGLTDTAFMTVTVNAALPNQPPIVTSISNDTTITLPDNSVSITVTGTDPEDGVVTIFKWVKISGPAAGAIASPTSSTTALTGLVEGVYIIQGRVYDSDGDSSFRNVRITVKPISTHVAPVANAGVDKTVTLPTDTLTLFGTATTVDGSICGYQWKEGGEVIGTDATILLTDLTAGVHTFTLVVTGDNLLTGEDTVTVTVNDAPEIEGGKHILLYKFHNN